MEVIFGKACLISHNVRNLIYEINLWKNEVVYNNLYRWLLQILSNPEFLRNLTWINYN